MKIDYIPDSVFKMQNLRVLGISGMDCDYVVLDANGNDVTQCWMIKEIPTAIKSLKNLESLGLNVNGIVKIPCEIAELKKLKVVDLTDNPGIDNIDILTKLESIEELYLYGCNLSNFPEDLGYLKNLKKLGIAGNRLSDDEKTRIKNELKDCEIVF